MREKSTRCRSKDGALAVLKDFTDRAEKVRAEIISPSEDRIADHQRTALSVHISNYMQHLIAKELNGTRINNSRSRLRRRVADCGFTQLADFESSVVERWLIDQQNRGMSAGTRNAYREVLLAFANWCVRTNRLLGNPLKNVPKADAKADCRRKRRALTEEELVQFLDAARRRPLLDARTIRTGPNKGKPVAKVSDHRQRKLERLGQERALIYKAYLLTGLRKSELASLTVGQLELDGELPFVVLDAGADSAKVGIVTSDNIVGQRANLIVLPTCRKILERADADMTGRDALENRAGQRALAHHEFARSNGRESAGRGNTYCPNGIE